jgi:hypothetical protein
MIKRIVPALIIVISIFCIVIKPNKIQAVSCKSETIYVKYTRTHAVTYWCDDSDRFCNLKTMICEKNISDQDKARICNEWGGSISYNPKLERNVCTITPSSEEDGSYLTDYPDGNKLKFADGNLGGIISEIIKIVYWIAGLSMMAMIIVGGLGVMTSVGIPEKTKMGYGKISNGLIGFLIIFSSYLIVKLVETMFGIKIF